MPNENNKKTNTSYFMPDIQKGTNYRRFSVMIIRACWEFILKFSLLKIVV